MKVVNFTIPNLNKVIYLLLLFFTNLNLSAQGTWKLWASGLQVGSGPRMIVAPNHDIFYTLLATAQTKGIVYKANTLESQGNFVALPAIPLPSSLQNNVVTIETNKNSEPIVGLFRSNSMEPWIFRFDNQTQTWIAATSDKIPTLGSYAMKLSKNGTIWVGAKWSYVYKSTDNGKTFVSIDETPIIKSKYPCYYPSWTGYDYDAAIYGINVDNNGRVYAGSESAGIIYSDDEGITWHPADYHPCKDNNPNQKDSNSSMKPLSYSGNVGGLGFTKDNNLVFTGGSLWTFNWRNSLAFADMKSHKVVGAVGLPDYISTVGQQITKIVTASNDQMFLHSGGSATMSGIGIYTSFDGIKWSQFNNGITGVNIGQAQGSLAVDSNKVFMATIDGKVWMYEVESKSDVENDGFENRLTINPNPICDYTVLSIFLKENSKVKFLLFDVLGREVHSLSFNINQLGWQEINLDLAKFESGIYSAVMMINDEMTRKQIVIQK